MRTKEKLIEKILHIDDESMLEDIMEMIDLELKLAEYIIILSDEQKNFVNEGLQDIEQGNLMNTEEVIRKSKEWLKKR